MIGPLRFTLQKHFNVSDMSDMYRYVDMFNVDMF